MFVGAFAGAILGLTVNLLNNFAVTHGGDAGTLAANSQGLYCRSACQQCPSAATVAGNLGSGC